MKEGWDLPGLEAGATTWEMSVRRRRGEEERRRGGYGETRRGGNVIDILLGKAGAELHYTSWVENIITFPPPASGLTPATEMVTNIVIVLYTITEHS